MRIVDVITTIKAERLFRRTPSGRPITEKALNYLDAAMEDKKNSFSEAIMCANCCIIQSSLLVESGCPNCGSKDLTTEITKKDVL